MLFCKKNKFIADDPPSLSLSHSFPLAAIFRNAAVALFTTGKYFCEINSDRVPFPRIDTKCNVHVTPRSIHRTVPSGIICFPNRKSSASLGTILIPQTLPWNSINRRGDVWRHDSTVGIPLILHVRDHPTNLYQLAQFPSYGGSRSIACRGNRARKVATCNEEKYILPDDYARPRRRSLSVIWCNDMPPLRVT